MAIDLITFMTKNNLKDEPIFDGQIHRFDSGLSSNSKSGWYIGHRVDADLILTIGEWTTDFHESWSSRQRMNSDQKLTFMRKVKEAIEKNTAEKEFSQETASLDCKNILNNSKQGLSDHKYLLKKCLSEVPSCSFDSEGNILVPVHDFSGKIWSIQYIDENGKKKFHPGGKISGNFHLISPDYLTDIIYVCEGFATGKTIFDCTGKTVLCAFSVGNIDSVIASLVIKAKGKKIVLCADNDRFKEKNAGLNNAIKMKNKYKLQVCFPVFDKDDLSSTDFNDLFIKKGKDFVVNKLDENVDFGVSYGNDFLYGKWIKFFQHTKEFKLEKELLSGVVYMEYGGTKKPVDNNIGTLKTIAKLYNILGEIDDEIGSYEVTDYLNRFCLDLKPKLFLEVKDWDGIDRIGNLLSYVKCENFSVDELSEIFKNFYANVFARLYKPENQNQMIILEGKQGIGKDSFIKNMFSCFERYFCDSAVRDKEEDNYYVMSSRLIINISEFDRASKKNVASLKNMITADSATFRMAYGAQAEEVRFRCSFISSCNLKDVLRDSTGNRRYIFAEINDIDWQYPKFDENDKSQLVAQAKYLYETGFKLSKELKRKIASDSENRTPDDPMELAMAYYEEAFKQLCFTRGLKNSLSYLEVAPIISEVAKHTGIGTKTFLSALKRTRRSHKDRTEAGKYRYYASPVGDLSLIELHKNSPQASGLIKNHAEKAVL